MARPLKRAFTLAESLLAVGLLALALLSLVGVLMYGLRLMQANRESTTSVEIARQLFETLRANPQLIPRTSSTFDGSVPTPATAAGFPPAPYPKLSIGPNHYVLNVRSAPVEGRADLLAVHVEVIWVDKHKVELDTYYYRP